MHNMNILKTQQKLLHLFIQSETILQNLLTSDDILDWVIDNASNQINNSVKTKKTRIKQNNHKILDYLSLTRKKEILNNEKQKVANMEMVIAVVGTMKAGKSTLINALVGQEILPNYGLAMTALPTLVTHKEGQVVPSLTLKQTQSLVKLRQQIITQLKSPQTHRNTPFIHSQAGQHLCKQLQTMDEQQPIATHYEGQVAILNILQHLNNLTRLATELNIAVPYKDYQQINQLPRIEVEFFHLKPNKYFQQTRLSFLDTPGPIPNAQRQSHRLNTIFQQQLEQSSAILLTVDYTQMNSEADNTMREDVKKIRSQFGQKLLVFVNKFDNANKNTMNVEQTKTYVSQQLMNNLLPKKYIFPVSSWWGYLAHKALITLETNNTLNPNDNWVKDFGEAALGRCWKKKIANKNEVTEASQALWKDSNFSNPINNIINNIQVQSAFKCLDCSLDKLHKLLNELNKNIDNHLVFIKKSLNKTQVAIKNINHEIKLLEEIKNKINDKKIIIVNEANKRIINKNNKHIKRAIKTTKIFIKTGYKENQRIAEVNRLEKTDNIYSEIDKKENNKIIYKRRDAAIYLLNDIQCYINSIKRILLEKSNSILEKNIREIENKISEVFDESFIKEFNKSIKKNPTPSYGKFILPKFIYKKHIESLQIKNLISIGMEEKNSTRQRTYVKNRLLNTLNKSWGKKVHKKKIKRFEIDTNKIKEYTHIDMINHTNSIEDYHRKYLEENIIKVIKEDTIKINNHIEKQYNYLINKLKEETEKNKRNKKLVIILEKSSQHIKPLLQDTKNQQKIMQKVQIKEKDQSLSSLKKKVVIS